MRMAQQIYLKDSQQINLTMETPKNNIVAINNMGDRELPRVSDTVLLKYYGVPMNKRGIIGIKNGITVPSGRTFITRKGLVNYLRKTGVQGMLPPEAAAATTVQRVLRGYTDRKEAVKQKVRKKAISKIGAAVRAMKQRTSQLYQNVFTYQKIEIKLEVNKDDLFAPPRIWFDIKNSTEKKELFYTTEKQSIELFDLLPRNTLNFSEKWADFRSSNITDEKPILTFDDVTFEVEEARKFYTSSDAMFKTKFYTFVTTSYPYVYVIKSFRSSKIDNKKAYISKRKLFNAIVKLDDPRFNGFVDSGNMQCVPELLLHHVKRNDLNKKITLESIVDRLGGEDASEGFTPLQIQKCLKTFKCHYKLMDCNDNIFIQSNPDDPRDRRLYVFVAKCYNQHIYYCNDKEYIKKISSSRINSEFHTLPIMDEKNDKEFEGVISETCDVNHLLIQRLFEDSTLVKCEVYNGAIISVKPTDGPEIVANIDGYETKSICKKFNINFTNQNMIKVSQDVFDLLYPNHKPSKFLPTTFELITKLPQIVRTFANPTGSPQLSVDKNKCRTSCIINNKLGEYPIFNYTCKVEDYSGNHDILGWYYCCDIKHEFIPSNVWLTGDFLKELDKRKVSYDVKYQIHAATGYPADYLKQYAEEMIDKLGDFSFKFAVNSFIGCLGKHIKKSRSGYVELDKDIAQTKFWDACDSNFGKIITNKDGISQKQICEKILTPDGISKEICEIFTIPTASYNDGVAHEKFSEIYTVEKLKIKKILTNDIPLYNKIIENEWLNMMELREMMGGKLLAIKTDNVICEYSSKKNIPKMEFSTEIGGYKRAEEIRFDKEIKCPDEIPKLEIDTDLKWNKIEVNLGEELDNFKLLREKITDISVLVNGRAGTGKSHCARNLEFFDKPETIIIAFTNKAAENLQAETICSKFGINFTTGSATRKKLESPILKQCKNIIVDEIYMVPSYCMNILIEVKMQYPDIKWTLLGDNKQLLPVKEEIDWLKTEALNFLCDGNICFLHKNMRNDFDKSYNQIEEGTFDVEPYFPFRKEPTRFHLVKTNRVRKDINELYMNLEKTANSRLIECFPELEYTQDTIVFENLPVMCVVNDKKLKLVNSNRATITQINDTGVYVDNQYFEDSKFIKCFVPAYAFTNHKVQGETIRVPYTIHEWSKMSVRERYTAFSRCGLTRDDISIKLYD